MAVITQCPSLQHPGDSNVIHPKTQNIMTDQPIVWTAMVTPMMPDGSIHFDNLTPLLRRQERAGNGIVILGSTGESLNLTPAERREIVDFTCELNLSVPVMAGVGGSGLQETLEWLAWLETRPIDAYLMVTPIYAKPGYHGQLNWFTRLMDAVSRPCMLYNVPSRAGTPLAPEVVAALREHPNFWSIKEASGSVSAFTTYVGAAMGAPVFSGDDAMMWDFAALGCSGVVSVASNIWPEATRLYTRMALERALTPEEIALWQDASDALFMASNPVPAKKLLQMEGHIDSPEVRLPLDAADLQCSERLIRASERITDWYHKCAEVADVA